MIPPQTTGSMHTEPRILHMSLRSEVSLMSENVGLFGQMGLTGWAEGYLTDSEGNLITGDEPAEEDPASDEGDSE
jgi:hypothetical protein